MFRTYKESDFQELLRLRCLLYPNHSEQELYNELIAFFYHPHSNPFRNYDMWTSFVYQREDGSLGGFIDSGFIYEDEYKERLVQFGNTDYFDQTQRFLSSCHSIPVVESWYVDEDLRGKHIGIHLMCKAEQWVKEHGCPFILSDTDNFRDVSKRAHTSLGYDTYHIDQNGCHYFYKRLV